jgi:hypothetical protein
LTFFVGIKDEFLAISPYSATATCGNFSWTYSGVDSNGVPLNFATDLIEVNSSNGYIKVAKGIIIGNYTI